jgi:hypothetical protein
MMSMHERYTRPVRVTSRYAIVGAAAVALLLATEARAQGSADLYAHYTPGACVQAVLRTTQAHWRTGPDTTRPNHLGRTILPASAEVARQCLAHFDPAKVIPRDLILLARVQLAAGDDEAAKRSIARRLATETRAPAAVRAKTLYEIVTAYIGAEPQRVTEALAHLKQLDAITDSVAVIDRLRAHAAVRYHYSLAQQHADAAREAATVISLWKRLDKHDQQEFSFPVWLAHMELVNQGADTKGGAGARAALATLRKDMAWMPNYARIITNQDSIHALYERKALPLTGDRMLGVEAGAALPRPGRVSMVIFNARRVHIPALRRLAAKYNDKLDVIVANRTYGSFRGEGPFRPEVEMDSLSTYLRDELAAPGIILLNHRDPVRIADGRLTRPPTSSQQAYHNPYGATVVLVDREGVIRFAASGEPDELRIDDQIGKIP